jgi:hypothetical protein
MTPLESSSKVLELREKFIGKDFNPGSTSTHIKACQDISDDSKRLQAFDSFATYVIGQNKPV